MAWYRTNISGNCASAERYGQTQTAVTTAAPPNAIHPRSFWGHPEYRKARGNKVMGKSFVNEPAARVMVDTVVDRTDRVGFKSGALGRLRISASAAIIAAIASESLWPLAANSTMTS